MFCSSFGYKICLSWWYTVSSSQFHIYCTLRIILDFWDGINNIMTKWAELPIMCIHYCLNLRPMFEVIGFWWIFFHYYRDSRTLSQLFCFIIFDDSTVLPLFTIISVSKYYHYFFLLLFSFLNIFATILFYHYTWGNYFLSQKINIS